MDHRSEIEHLLPLDPRAALVGRVQLPGERGAHVVARRDDRLVDLTTVTPTVADLLERPDLLEIVRTAEAPLSWSVDDVVESTLAGGTGPRLVSPVDLQVIKAAGVTFARSMIERVIEEKAGGDASRAVEIRARVQEAIGGTIGAIRPGSPEAEDAKRILIEEGLWSQYLEVGIGPDPEIFSKAPVLSSVGTGAEIGVLSRSTWNNPEPEVALLVTRDGRSVGATLGNDVNLRDFEGRSALLLGEAKDNNGSCSLGPMIRLFDDTFSQSDAARLEVGLRITGADGFELVDGSSMREMSRTLDELVRHTVGDHHQYPDGFVLFTGTLFAPTQDRDSPGLGFTHHDGDVVRISAPELGTLVNRVTSSEACPPWTFGIRAFYTDLAERGLLPSRQGVAA
ncbi:Fumarylacetoacetate (FAA) hydrolase family protein [Rathayibacter oskolensis]|uniref:Fumarylacetoacetate (FAA) hydrolase family protein n=1 Tax=Rathayibacter oskolensis TaxID=1891671 RepID=A0A1X7PE18_9MICO|nr:fumarylacetoacetate hydrolase family protein [Rathayibacter oskolensis]SMH48855.1 Fumarylacetoacetate (FAA) hydrolase family protein [Rathayibacter oskolensis]